MRGKSWAMPPERVEKVLQNSRQSSQGGESITDMRRGSSQSAMQGSAFLCVLPFCLVSPWLPPPSPIQNDSEALVRGFLPTLESSFKHNEAPLQCLCFKLQPRSWAFECQQLRRHFYAWLSMGFFDNSFLNHSGPIADQWSHNMRWQIWELVLSCN